MTKPKAKKGKSPATTSDKTTDSTSTSSHVSSKSSDKEQQPSSSALIICRNKHWRYISSFHGPWLQLPPEVLESLAYSNYHAPRPRPIDPAVFFDLVKIRKYVDEATNLAVRAASGLASSALLKDSGLLGGSAAGVLGLGISGGGPTPKLSRERKHRMRELATQKLAKAYKLDEIAASVATMQSASSLEDVANLVLNRVPNDPDAKYVHFFHEKIPSRMLAKCTPLAPLDLVIAERPSEGAPLRTRAVTKVFKEDYAGAAADLTTALNVCKHRRGNRNHDTALVSARSSPTIGGRMEDDDQPSSLEAQLLFHRASTYLTIACQHVEAALPPKGTATSDESGTSTPEDEKAHALREQARKPVRVHAKRALRDYMKFLSFFDYAPGLPFESSSDSSSSASSVTGAIEQPPNGNSYTPNNSHPDREAKRLMEVWYPQQNGNGGHQHGPPSDLPTHQISTLFSSPPSDLPPYPSTALVTSSANGTFEPAETTESLTYHPLLTDALHSLLLCHTLINTPPKELTRHAHMVARLCRVADGYPIFLAARSPARADWMEVLKRTPGRLDLAGPWEQLCAPAPLLGEGRKEDGGGRWAQEEGKEYPVSTERAGVLVKWIRECKRREGVVNGVAAAAAAAAAEKKEMLAIAKEAPPMTPTTVEPEPDN